MKNLRLTANIHHQQSIVRVAIAFEREWNFGCKITEIYTQASVQEIGKINNPLDDFYKTKSSTIQAQWECIV